MALTHRERIDTQFFGENRQFDDAVEPIGRWQLPRRSLDGVG